MPRGMTHTAEPFEQCGSRMRACGLGTYHLRTELVLDAFDMAVAQRQPTSVVHHSDRGTQYTSIAFGQRCRQASVQPSMGSVGDAYDNALCESFFASLECELLAPRNGVNSTERPVLRKG